jgi:hypothetical protein
LRLRIGTYLHRRVQESLGKDFEIRLRTPLNKPRIHCQLSGFEIARIPTQAIEPLDPGRISVGRAQRNSADGRNALELVDGGHLTVVEEPATGASAAECPQTLEAPSIGVVAGVEQFL